MAKTFSTAVKIERAVMVALINQHQSAEKTAEYLDELAFLAETSGVKAVKFFTQRLEKPDIRTFVGKGKLEEIIDYVKEFDIEVVIFDDDLTPSQLRNLENLLKVKIYDRSLLILDIFLQRAQTAQAKTQVELARFQYLLPRLTRMWTHLERQRGGTGTRGGAGEKEIETDRRSIRNQITLLKEKLKKIEKQSETQRKSRSNIVRVAFVGYTNVGKSTLMRLLTQADVLAENKLFATVDATVRKVVLNQIPFLLSDTVGFIRKLPHHLIESFKSTLAEVREADILLHVADISHPSFAEQVKIVNETLKDIGAENKVTIMVFNKVDLLNEDDESDQGHEEPVSSSENKVHPDDEFIHRKIQSNFIAKENEEIVFISAEKKINIDKLKEVLIQKVEKRHFTIFPNYLKKEEYKGEY
jgi:GTPase